MESCEISFHNLFNDNNLYEDTSYLADATLLTEDGWSFDVHRVILVRDSSFFRKFFSNFRHDNKVSLIPRVKGEIMNQILWYIYTGDIAIKRQSVSELLIASDFLQVDYLVMHILNNLSIENCIAIYMTSLQINDEYLMKLSYRFIQTSFEELIYKNPEEFVEISFDSLRQLLSDNNLRVSGEHAIWSSIVKWVLKEPALRMCKVYDLLTCMKLDGIDHLLANSIIRNYIILENPIFENLNLNQLLNNDRDSLDVVKWIFEVSKVYLTTPAFNFGCARRPSCLHLITYFSRRWKPNNGLHHITRLYITYDENIDVWREIGETDYVPSAFFVNDHILYIFDSIYQKLVAFNLITIEWYGIKVSPGPFFIFTAVMLGNSIVCIGSEFSGQESVMMLKFYNTDWDMWFNGTTIESADNPKAVLYRNRVYIVGNKSTEANLYMIAQIYCKDSNSCFKFMSPKIYRKSFELIEYHGRLFLIGGKDESNNLLKTVEVFDCEEETWNLKRDLPFLYHLPRAIFFCNELIVLEDDDEFSRSNAPVVWNETAEEWELLKKPLNTEDLRSYKFATISDSDTIDALVEESRDPYTHLERSPFN